MKKKDRKINNDCIGNLYKFTIRTLGKAREGTIVYPLEGVKEYRYLDREHSDSERNEPLVVEALYKPEEPTVEYLCG